MDKTDVYTVLMLIAAVALLAAVAFVVYRSNQLFGGNPLDPSAMIEMTAPARAAIGLA